MIEVLPVLNQRKVPEIVFLSVHSSQVIEMVSNFRNRGIYLIGEEYCILNVCERIVENGSCGSCGTPSDNEEHGKHVIVDVVGLDEN